MSMLYANALVQIGASSFEFQEFPLPAPHEQGSALIRVEANGLCHTDVECYKGGDTKPPVYPRIMGHEIVGVVEDLGPHVKYRRDLSVGDRVAVNPFLSCGRCVQCLRGTNNLCNGFDLPRPIHGFIPTNYGPGLWGGYSTHVYASPSTILYRFPPEVDAFDATLWNPLAAGFQWALRDGGATVGSRVLVLGPGQRGLATIIALRAAGAGSIVVTGLSRDAHKLRLARDLGANMTIDVGSDDVVECAMELSGGDGFDVVVDTTPYATQPVLDAVNAVAVGGTVVLAAPKGRTVEGFPIDRAIVKKVRVVTSNGQSNDAYQQAADLIASNKFPELSRMRTHVFGFDQLSKAIDALTGATPDSQAINVVVTPTTT